MLSFSKIGRTKEGCKDLVPSSVSSTTKSWITLNNPENLNQEQWFPIFFSVSGTLIIRIQSNSVVTNITGQSIFIRFGRDFVITVKIHIVKL